MKQKIVIRILLLVAKMVADPSWQPEIQNLANHIAAAKDPES